MRFFDSVILTIQCPICGKEHEVEVSETALYKWQNGALIQNAMPTLSAVEREQILSHICPACQVSIFGEEDAEDDEGDDITACMQDSLASTGQWW